MAISTQTLRIAIIVNHPPKAHFWAEIKQAFVDSFEIITPHAQLDFYDPIDKQEYPDASQYNLIMLSGGKADASASEPWILKELEFIRTTAREAPKTNILGICWGHQALLRAFGGRVAAVPSGPIAGLVRVELNAEGRKFFPFAAEKGSYVASQFHVREVAEGAEGFFPLAENNECFLSESNTMLGLQAHPEIGREFSMKILMDDDTTYTEGRTEAEVAQIRERAGGKQDGIDLLRRVVEWVYEK